ncbi:unnamed protein product, partial [Discosporangium mesarthrocarpum]
KGKAAWSDLPGSRSLGDHSGGGSGSNSDSGSGWSGDGGSGMGDSPLLQPTRRSSRRSSAAMRVNYSQETDSVGSSGLESESGGSDPGSVSGPGSSVDAGGGSGSFLGSKDGSHNEGQGR